MSSAQNLNATEVFRKQYHGYQKMADQDYLDHALLFGYVKAYLKTHEKAVRLLDLGCGDSGNLAKILPDISSAIASYTGVDMSESALQTAQRLMQRALGNHFPLFFHVSDMLSYLKQCYATYDVVLAAFSLHHLTEVDKKETMTEVRRLLSPEGVFIMVDPFRREQESLTEYRKRAAQVGETWVCMGREQQDTFIKHMLDYDIMETESWFDETLKEAGFSSKEVICRGKKGLESNAVVFKQ